MEDKELIEKMLGDIEKKDKDAKDLLDNISETRLTSLKETIGEILSQIEFRENLHNEMMSDLETLKSNINNMMTSLPTASLEGQKAMVEFQKQIVEADQMKVTEKLNNFRDIATLKKELREIIREFREKETRSNLLGDLLKD